MRRENAPLAALLLLFVFAAPFESSAQDAGRFLRWSANDASAYLQEAAPRAPFFVAGGAALLLTGTMVDQPILSEVQEHSAGVGDFLGVTNEFGGVKVAPAAAGVFAATLLTGNEKLQDAAFTSLQSIVYSGASVYAIKYAVGRFRPETGQGAEEYQMFSGNTSFPSGHTATAFALVTPWAMYYPGPVTYGLMAIPVGTAVARIAKDRHWPTDVLAGAAIGYMTARFLSKRHLADAPYRPGKIEVTPSVAPGAMSLSLRLNF